MIKSGISVPNNGMRRGDMRNEQIFIQPLSDTSIIITFGNEIDEKIHLQVQSLSKYLEQNPFKGFVEYVSAFTSVTVFYDPLEVLEGSNNEHTPYQIVHQTITSALGKLQTEVGHSSRKIDIPVCYGGEFGEDLEVVADHNNLTTDQVIEIHSSGDYLVYMIGFAPGFPYLGGMSKSIATPRRSNPRTSIPKGSVGIAGEQTGVYSLDTPGGWQIIGKTPLDLFRPEDDTPSLLQPGDRVQFKPITEAEYHKYKEKIT